ILPNSNRTFTSDWRDGFPLYSLVESENVEVDSQGERIRSLEWNMDEVSSFRFGKYTAHLVLAYDDGTRDVPLESTIEFWVIPWRLILIALAIPILPAVIVF